MCLQFIFLVGGLLLIIAGAYFLVDGASSVARRTGVSEFVIGTAIVGIGTSVPEMAVSFYAALDVNADIAVGNIIGSNIFNTAFILGISALISPIVISKIKLRRDIPMNIVAILLLAAMSFGVFKEQDAAISRVEGGVLVALFIAYMYFLFKLDKRDDEEIRTDSVKLYSTALSIVFIIGGIAALAFGGRLFVKAAEAIAEGFGLPDAFIAITLMALGTSIPELTTCIVASAKGRNQLSLGNILGSNVSNVLLIVGGSALIHPLRFSGIRPADFVVLLVLALFLFACSYMFRRRKIDRIEGVILILIGVAYMVWLMVENLWIR